MPIPIAIASFNKKVTNRLTAPFAGHLPGFAVVRHRGRTSGRMYRTPVNAFRRSDDYVFVMTYGPDATGSGTSRPPGSATSRLEGDWST